MTYISAKSSSEYHKAHKFSSAFSMKCEVCTSLEKSYRENFLDPFSFSGKYDMVVIDLQFPSLDLL